MNAPAQIGLADVFGDEKLAAWLDQRRTSQHAVVYAHAQYLCKIFSPDVPGEFLVADPENKSKSALKKLANKGWLRRVEMSLAILTAAKAPDPAWASVTTAPDEIAYLVEARGPLLGRVSGRGQPITDKTAWHVWNDAGGRCMFTGCGVDLTRLPLHTHPAKIGYLAHVVASDPNGPRGTQADSHRLSDAADNIMLMCDAHHRLIDCFAPQDYPADRLCNMRRHHVSQVRMYLDSLAYPQAKAISFHANLAGVPTHFRESEFLMAILEARRAMAPGVTEYIRRTQRDDRLRVDFWVNYLHEHENHISTLVTSFSNPANADVNELAIFPLHHTPTLVLAGRIVGEARPVQVFQYDRARASWAWDANAAPRPPGTFKLTGLDAVQRDEVLVSIELSGILDAQNMPPELQQRIDAGTLHHVRLFIAVQNNACIRHFEDLQQFRTAARAVINHVQDTMRARRVHLIAMCPASAVFSFGQMLQAGNHPPYIVYDRPNFKLPFAAAFTITGQSVSATTGQQTKTIPIR